MRLGNTIKFENKAGNYSHFIITIDKCNDYD